MTKDQWTERISKITPSLYVSEIAIRAFPEWLAELNVDTVISLLKPDQAKQYDVVFPVSPKFRHKTFDVGDSWTLTPQEIDEILASFGKVTLLHCISGSNRSSAIAMCNLMSQGMGAFEAAYLYFTTRGLSTAEVYKTTPKMSIPMRDNVKAWAASKGVKA